MKTPPPRPPTMTVIPGGVLPALSRTLRPARMASAIALTLRNLEDEEMED